jgi:electron transport complex protein RnfD
MQTVLLATVPGIVALTHFFGFGVLVNLVWACIVALACEALALALRRRPIGFYLKDCSALVTATLLAVALPPYSPWWLIAVGIACAILLAKHLYGGLGYNPFNPAMAGYVILLISFPVQMTAWAPPRGLEPLPGFMEALQACFWPSAYDGTTMATPLDLMKQNTGLLLTDLYAQTPQFGRWAGSGLISPFSPAAPGCSTSAYSPGTRRWQCSQASPCSLRYFMTAAVPPAAAHRCFTC